MKKIVLCIMAIFSFMLATNAQVAAASEDKIIFKNFSITFYATADEKVKIKITAQYRYNEARKLCSCSDLTYDKIKSEAGYETKVRTSTNNPLSDFGGAYIYVDTRYPNKHTVDKLLIEIKFDYIGKVEYEIATVG